MFGDNLFDECVRVIENWMPNDFSIEKEYQNDLREFLFKTIGRDNNVNIKLENSRALCDIAIGRLIGIELKFGKNGKISKSEIDRLHGQVAGHIKEYSEGIIIVLVGDVNKYSEADVKDKLRDLYNLINEGNYFEDYPMKLINKSKQKIKKQKKEQESSDNELGLLDLF